MKTEEELEIWNMVHDWCDGIYQDIQVAYIPDTTKRYLMDLIAGYTKKQSIKFVNYALKEGLEAATAGRAQFLAEDNELYDNWGTAKQQRE